MTFKDDFNLKLGVTTDVNQKKIQTEIDNKTKNTKVNADLNLKLDKQILNNRINTYLKNNSKLTDEYKVKLENVKKSLKEIDKVQLRSVRKEFNALKTEASAVGVTGKSVFEKFKGDIGNFLTFVTAGGAVMSGINTIRNMVDEVKNLDDSLVELRKVSNLTGEALDDFVDKAYYMGAEVARTGKEIIDATTVFKRAGYTLEQSLDMAKASLVMVNVGDGIRNVDEASSSLIATLKGFKLSDTDAMSVIDMINSTSNQAAIDFDNITEGLRRVSGTLSQTGTSIQETIGLLTGGFGSLRDIEMVSSGLVMISQRLRGIGEDGEEIDGLAPKLKKDFKDIANIDIEDANGSLRSTYDILSDMSRVFPTLTAEQRQYLGELAAGNRQVKVLNAITQGWSDVTQAVDSATNSQGSALTENEKVLNSITGKINAFRSAFQEMSTTTIDSDTIKFFVDLGTSILKATTAVGGLVPVLVTLGVSVGITRIAMNALLSSTEKHTIANLATTVSQYGLSVAIKDTAKSIGIFMATNPVGWILALGTAVFGVTKLYDALNTSLEEQKEALETANTAYEESKTKLESINSELKTTEERINALEAKDNLTFVEDGELQKLKDITAELLIQQDIQQRRKDEDAKALAETASDTFKKQFGDKQWNFTTPEQQISDEQSAFDMYGTSYEDESSIYKLIAAYKEFNELKSEALQKENLYGDDSQKELDYYAKSLEGVNVLLTSNLDDLKLQKADMQDYYDVIKNTPYEELNSEQKTIYDNYNAISNAIELIYTNINPAKWKEIKFTEVFNSSEMASVKKQLEELAKAGELTPDVFESNSRYQTLLTKTGLSADEVATQINGMVEVIKDAPPVIENSKTAILSLSDALKNLSNNAEFSDNIKKEFKEIGTISTDSLNKIISTYPLLEGAVSDYLRQKITETELIKELDKAYQTDLDNYRNAVVEKKSLDEGFYTDVVNNLPDLVKDLADSYQIDFDNYKNLQEMKLDIYQKYASEIAKVEGLLAQDTQESYEDALIRATKFVSPLSKIIGGLESSIDVELDLKGYTPDPRKDTKSKKSSDPIKDAFDREYNALKYNLDKQLITEAEYYDTVEKLNKKYYKNKKKYIDDFRKYDVEVLKGRQKLEEEFIKSKFDDLSHSFAMGDIKTEESYQKQRWELAKDYYKNNKDYLDEWKNAQEEWYKWNLEQAEETAKKQENIAENLKDKYTDLIGEIADEVKKEKDDVLDSLDESHKRTIKNLEEQKDSYKEIVETQLELLDAKKKQNEYEKSIANKTKEISKIESRRSELEKAAKSGDRSAIAELAKLDEELSKKKEDLLDEQSDHEYDLQKESLNNALDLNDKLMTAKIDAEKLRFETQKSNIEKLYDKEIELINKAAQYTKDEFGKALDEIAVQLASNGITQSPSYLNNVKNAQNPIAGSVIDTSTANRSAILAILSNGTGKDYKEEASALASYTRDNYGNPISKKQAVEVAKLLGVSGINSVDDLTGNDENKNKILEALRKARFSKGGYVDASMIKRVGEDGLALVKNGEPILTVEQGKLFKELVNNIKPLNNLVKLSTPNISNITNKNSSPNITVNLPPSTTIDNDAINNYRKLIPELTNAISEELLGTSRQFK